jgi:hypothetical protein
MRPRKLVRVDRNSMAANLNRNTARFFGSSVRLTAYFRLRPRDILSGQNVKFDGIRAVVW